MKWRLIVGLGAEAILRPDQQNYAERRSMAWFEVYETAPVELHYAIDAAKRAADAMLEYAVRMAKRTDPILVAASGRFRAAFTARVIVEGDIPINLVAGPEEFDLDSAGVAIAVGRSAVFAGARALRENIDAVWAGAA